MRRPKTLHLRTASDVELETKQILRLRGLFEPCHNGRNHRSLPVSKLSVRLEYSLVKCSTSRTHISRLLLGSYLFQNDQIVVVIPHIRVSLDDQSREAFEVRQIARPTLETYSLGSKM